MIIQNQVPDFSRKLYRPLYDTLVLAAGAIGTKQQLFINPVSATKGLELTNMQFAKQLAPGERFEVFALKARFVGFSQSDLDGVLKNYALTFTIGGRPVWQGPLHECPGGGGAAGYAATTAAATTLAAATNGVADPRASNQFPADLFIPIADGDAFIAELSSVAGFTMVGTGQIALVLEGIYYDSVR